MITNKLLETHLMKDKKKISQKKPPNNTFLFPQDVPLAALYK